jgi:formamidopyrimidine-DNA glycosylase
MAGRFRSKKAPIKAALLDQRVVAGLGNIYVGPAPRPYPARCRGAEAGAKERGALQAARRPGPGGRTVLIEAVERAARRCTFRAADGGPGYFQHRFAVL